MEAYPVLYFHYLLGVGCTERPAVHRKIIGVDKDLPPVDLAVSRNDAVAGNMALLHSEIGAAVLHKLVELDKRALVQKFLDAFASRKLAARMLFFYAIDATAQLRIAIALLEFAVLVLCFHVVMLPYLLNPRG